MSKSFDEIEKNIKEIKEREEKMKNVIGDLMKIKRGEAVVNKSFAAITSVGLALLFLLG